MSTILDRTNAFIEKFELPDTPEFRESLGDYVTGCWGDHFKIVQSDQVPDDKKSAKVTKAEKIEDPSECKERDDLRNCTSATLNEYCKKHGLRVGGNKKEVTDRVWRFLQGNNSEDDISPRTKPKKEKKINEKHDCCGCTSKGTPCAVAATVEVDGHWFCWRHEETCQEIISNLSKKGEPAKKGESSKKVKESEPEVKKGKKVKEPEPVKKGKSDKNDKKSKVPEPEPVSESEEEEEEVEKSELETDDE
jgi:hypothetical protein